MNPETPETRIGRLETTVAKLEQRTDDHEIDIRAFAPITASHAVLTQQIITLQQAMDGVVRRLDEDQKERQVRQADASKDSRQWRRAILLLGMSSFVTVLVAAATITATVLS